MNLTNIRDIQSLLKRHGFSFSKSLGQNFLTADWVPQDITAAAEVNASVGVLEIGPGIGCLTEKLSDSAGYVVSLEVDRALLPVLAETVGPRENVTILHQDVLTADLSALVHTYFNGLTPIVCANLPYHITTPILTKLIDSGLFAQITVMVQREVAHRMVAAANTKDYGAFSAYIAYHTEPEILFDVPADCFVPAPKVTSSVITLKKRETPPVSVDHDALFRVIKAAFSQRRKTLANCLAGAYAHLPKASIESALEQLGYDRRIRGEVLDLNGFAAVAKALDQLA